MLLFALLLLSLVTVVATHTHTRWCVMTVCSECCRQIAQAIAERKKKSLMKNHVKPNARPTLFFFLKI